jgi:hypothetical protein
MPKCKNDASKTYEGTEPSPKGMGYCAHAEKVGSIRKGKDGNTWIVKTVRNGIKRWIKFSEESKINLKGYKKYFIHNNGGRPYLVYNKGNSVYIYKSDKSREEKKDNDLDYNKLEKHIDALKVFIGKSPDMKMTRSSGTNNKINTDGNTILLHLDSKSSANKINHKYMIISECIKIFTTNDDEITYYFSPIGNSDVPYPFAIGKKYVYVLWNEGGYLDKKYFANTNNNLDDIINKIFEYEPFFTPLNKKKRAGMTIEEFEEIKNTPLKDISLNTIQKIAKLYNVKTSGSKQDIIIYLKKLRDVHIGK